MVQKGCEKTFKVYCSFTWNAKRTSATLSARCGKTFKVYCSFTRNAIEKMI